MYRFAHRFFKRSRGSLGSRQLCQKLRDEGFKVGLDQNTGYTIAELEYSWKDIIESIPKSTFFNTQNIATLANSNIHLTQKVLNELVYSNMLEVV